jgi:hypothetical protein
MVESFYFQHGKTNMKKFAFVFSNGEIAYIASPYLDDFYQEGVQYSGFTCREMPVESSDKDFISQCVWDKDLGWKKRPPKNNVWEVWDGQTSKWVDARDTAFYAAEVKAKRQQLLSASDWTQLPDVPLVTKEAWAAYRQALRDITEQTSYPQEVVWPNPPA